MALRVMFYLCLQSVSLSRFILAFTILTASGMLECVSFVPIVHVHRRGAGAGDVLQRCKHHRLPGLELGACSSSLVSMFSKVTVAFFVAACQKRDSAPRVARGVRFLGPHLARMIHQRAVPSDDS